MNPKGVLYGKKIYIMTQDAVLLSRILASLTPHGASLFHQDDPGEAIADAVAKNCDLLIYDETYPAFHNATALSMVKKLRPRIRTLLFARSGSPLRSIDVSAQGVSFSIQHDANAPTIYNGVKHALSITSVPRVEVEVM
ncbi:MAG: hypothetical protein P9L94_14355 [Candidatus Hinthialibacter antarcticus]|nr:hypothetical protein [Candidatus Hinthialibacter antarcticus]